MEAEKMDIKPQVFGSLGVCMGFFVLGSVIAYPTKALPQLLDGTDPDVSLTEDEGSWFVTIFPIIGLCLTTSGGALSAKFGRKMIILCSAPNVAIGWLILYFAQDKFMLFTGRLITCIFTCSYLSSIGVYISETVHPNLRGKLVVLSPLFLAMGMLMDWTIGYFYTWRTIAFNASISSMILFIIMFILPETPYWLIEKDQFEKASKSLQFFRGKSYDISQEIQEIQDKHSSKDIKRSWKFLIKRIFSRAFFKPFSCIGVIHIMFTLTGFDIIVIYMVSILQETGSGIDPNLGPMIAGIVRVSSAGFTPILMGRIAPKLQFTLCQAIASICMASLAFLAFMNQNFSWIPLAVILTSVLMRAIGTLPVMHTLMNESYPTEIRTQAISLTESMSLGLGAINLKIFANLKPIFGIHGLCLCYATIGLICTVYGALTIPDNRGKSLVKVEEFYEKKETGKV